MRKNSRQHNRPPATFETASREAGVSGEVIFRLNGTQWEPVRRE